MMNFVVECDDDVFQLVLPIPGDTRVDAPLEYFSVSTIVAPGGMVCGVYMDGSEPEFRALEEDPNPEAVTVVSKLIKVYDLTHWPNIKPIEANVTLQLTDLSGDDDDDADDEDDSGVTLDVEPIS